jgi:hypothetical protein
VPDLEIQAVQKDAFMQFTDFTALAGDIVAIRATTPLARA